MQIQGKRDAVRILFVIAKAGEPVKRSAPQGTCLVVHAEKRLQALDFWMRNPDYLASEILNQYEADTSRKPLLEMAEDVMRGDEPDIRRIAMQRFLFGAWEALDDAISTLSLPGLVKMHRSFTADGTRIRQSSYYLTDEGAAKAAELENVEPLDWYADRAQIVAKVAGNRTFTGPTSKKRPRCSSRYWSHRTSSKRPSARSSPSTSVSRSTYCQTNLHGRPSGICLGAFHLAAAYSGGSELTSADLRNLCHDTFHFADRGQLLK